MAIGVAPGAGEDDDGGLFPGSRFRLMSDRGLVPAFRHGFLLGWGCHVGIMAYGVGGLLVAGGEKEDGGDAAGGVGDVLDFFEV